MRAGVCAGARIVKPPKIPLSKGVLDIFEWKSRGGITVPPLFQPKRGRKEASKGLVIIIGLAGDRVVIYVDFQDPTPVADSRSVAPCSTAELCILFVKPETEAAFLFVIHC